MGTYVIGTDGTDTATRAATRAGELALATGAAVHVVCAYERRGWHYSEFDQKVNIEWCEKLRRLGHRPRVALILTITRAARQVTGNGENWQGYPNVVRATIGRCHCFIAAYRIRPDGRYSMENITLKCPHLAGH